MAGRSRQYAESHNSVAAARFADHRHATFVERFYIAIHGAQAKIETISNLLRSNLFFTLQVRQNCVQSVDAVQIVASFVFCVSGSSIQAPCSFNMPISSSTGTALSTFLFTISFPL